jgi:predicted outer membrane repeat protein
MRLFGAALLVAAASILVIGAAMHLLLPVPTVRDGASSTTSVDAAAAAGAAGSPPATTMGLLLRSSRSRRRRRAATTTTTTTNATTNATGTTDTAASGNALFGGLFDGFYRLYVAARNARTRWNKFRCESVTFLPPPCICRTDQLERAVAALKRSKSTICHDTTLTVSTELNLTQSYATTRRAPLFVLGCDVLLSPTNGGATGRTGCELLGGGNNRFFSGAPRNVLFSHIEFAGGSADQGGVAEWTAGDGGAAGGGGGQVTFRYCTFRNNRATRGNGGAIALMGNGGPLSVLFERVTIENNTASGSGGAVYAAATGGGSVAFVDAAFTGNLANNGGGAIGVVGTKLRLDFARFASSNRATDGNNVWVGDDSDPAAPTATGSFVNCTAFLGKTTFCGNLGLFEIAGSGGQKYANTNCAATADVVTDLSAFCVM